ncbi:MAG: hypothetical protein KA248_01855 [Kiritimatiellae bacterium]|nr:hypothetical protein [Kiritimatiellia bacterium]
MKKNYEKPSIRKIKLVPSEAVLQACKTIPSGGPQATGCIMLSTVGPCSTIGS